MPPINSTGPGLSDYSSSKFFQPGLAGTTVPATPSFEEDGDYWVAVARCGMAIPDDNVIVTVW